MGDIEDKIHSKMSKIKPCYLLKKTDKEVKPHYFEESKDKVVEGEIDNDDNDEYVYYFLVERAPTRSRGCNGV